MKMLLLHTKAPLHCRSPRLPKNPFWLQVSTGQNWGWRLLCSRCACCRRSAVRLPVLLSDCRSCCQTASPSVAEFWLTSSELGKEAMAQDWGWMLLCSGCACFRCSVVRLLVLLSDCQPHSGRVLTDQFWTCLKGPWLRTDCQSCCQTASPAVRMPVLLSDRQPHSGRVLIDQFWTCLKGDGSDCCDLHAAWRQVTCCALAVTASGRGWTCCTQHGCVCSHLLHCLDENYAPFGCGASVSRVNFRSSCPLLICNRASQGDNRKDFFAQYSIRKMSTCACLALGWNPGQHHVRLTR